MPVQLNPAHAAVVIHSPQPTTHELKRPREEEEEVVMSQPLMDFELLTTIVSMYLEENSESTQRERQHQFLPQTLKSVCSSQALTAKS